MVGYRPLVFISSPVTSVVSDAVPKIEAHRTIHACLRGSTECSTTPKSADHVAPLHHIPDAMHASSSDRGVTSDLPWVQAFLWESDATGMSWITRRMMGRRESHMRGARRGAGRGGRLLDTDEFHACHVHFRLTGHYCSKLRQ